MSSDTRVEFTQDGALGILTLDNPPLNLISEELISDLLDAIAEVEAAREVRALLVRGKGKVFSAGADVALFAGKSADQMRPLISSFLELGRRIERLSFPTLAAVHGTCIAGAFELALFCDLIWAAEGTMLGLPETRLGIVPLAGRHRTPRRTSRTRTGARRHARRGTARRGRTCQPGRDRPRRCHS